MKRILTHSVAVTEQVRECWSIDLSAEFMLVYLQEYCVVTVRMALASVLYWTVVSAVAMPTVLCSWF